MSEVAPYGPVDGLRLSLDNGVLRLVLDRPDKRNALDDVMVAGLIDALDAANRDEAVRVIVLAGNGDHFCGGADIVARNSRDPSAPRPRVGSIQRRTPSLAHRLIPLVTSVQVPIVCAVRGWAAGIGCQLALAADFTVAADDATFWEPFMQRGFTPDSGATWMLPRRVGMVQARRMLLLGERVDGATAATIGMIHEAVPTAQVDGAADVLAARLAAGPTVALGLTKWLLHAGRTTELDEQLRNESLALELSSRSDDFREGLAAFRDKRSPEFKGR